MTITTHQLPEVVKDAGDCGVGVIILLRWLHLPPSFAYEPGCQGGEEIKLFSRVGSHSKVVPVNRQCS